MSRCPSQDWDAYCRHHDAPVVTMLKQKATRARKEHKCEGCRDPIAPGTLYERVVYVDYDQTPAKLVSLAFHRPHCPSDVIYDETEEYVF